MHKIHQVTGWAVMNSHTEQNDGDNMDLYTQCAMGYLSIDDHTSKPLVTTFEVFQSGKLTETA